MQPVPDAAATRQDRPRGYFPRGTSLGLAGMGLLAVAVPFNVLQCAAPFTPNGFDRWLNAIPFVFPLGFVPIVLIIIIARTHQYWAVRAFFYFGCATLTGYALSLIFAVVAVTGVLPLQETGLRPIAYVGLIYNVLAMGILAWFLLRMLRLRYWQPGSTPDMWEAGDEGPPAWALSPRGRDPK
jgi:FtsH-binding integral membrane protein